MLINGIESDQVFALDRGYQYGDGLFETIKVADGVPQYWDQHISRLVTGCDRLNIARPDISVLQNEARTLCKNSKEGVLKIIITRGSGGRGYAIENDMTTTRVLAMFPLPVHSQDCWKTGVTVRVCQTRLGLNPALAGIKHLNRLEQVLARSEWNDPNIQEGLMMDVDDKIIEGTMSNVFCVTDKQLLTPSLTRCGINGIIREQVIRIARQKGMAVKETDMTFDQICGAQEIFLTNSIIGVWPVRNLDGHEYETGPVAYQMSEQVKNNTSWG